MIRKSNAVWNGNLKSGNGTFVNGNSGLNANYSFNSRFEDGQGTNPEELIAAAHAGCFSMALSAGLEKAGYTPEKVETTDKVHLEKDDSGFNITKIEVVTRAKVSGGIEEVEFQKIAENTKNGCPVSKALTGVKFELDARLD